MDKQPVGQLPDLTQSNNDDEIMVITNDEYNQLKKEKISDLITDFTSTNENNAIVKGTDGKMFVTDFGNASNITEGTLPTSVLPEIPLEKIPDIPKDKLPQIETADLPVSGVTADTYAYPSSVTVNAQGMVTAIAEGTPSGANADTDLSNLTPAGEKHFLNKTQLTNCILEAPNGVATYSGTTITVKQGLKVLIPNGRNADGTMNNIEYTLPQDLTYTNPFAYNSEYYLWLTYANGTCSVTGASTSIPFLAQEEQPDIFYAKNCIWYKPSENLIYSTANYPTTPFTPVRVCFLGKFTSTASNAVTSFTPYPTLEIIKRTDPEIQAPYVYRSYRNGNSWYKLWSDGFIEQGGLVTAAQNGDVVTFLQPYSTVVLDIQLTCSWIGSNYNSGYNTATRQNFKFYTALPLTIEPGVAVNWYSCGY